MMEGDGNLRQGTVREGRKRGKRLMTVNEIEATEGEEKVRSHEGDVKSLRQARRKTGRWRRKMKGSRE